MQLFYFATAIFAVAVCSAVQSINAEHISDASNVLASVAAPVGDTPNSEMRDLFLADQAIRLEVEKRGGWIAVKDDKTFLEKWEREDFDRLKRTSALLEMNALKTGLDFYHAAYIFQHSKKSEDFLKAHHLSVIAISKGYDARWISAATLDRYLQSIGRQQIYGTQFLANEVGEYIRQPVEAGIVSDPERAQLNVPALSEGW